MTPNNLPQLTSKKLLKRDAEIANLHQLLQQNHQVVIAGDPGTGKTTLALQYAHQYLDYYPQGICWIFANCGDIIGQIIQFTKTYLKIPPVNNNALVLSDGCLIILDDVSYLSQIQAYLSARSANFKLLITTRFPELINPDITLDILEKNTALELLKLNIGLSRIKHTQGKGFNVKLSQESLGEKICEKLEYLPFNIQLASKYLQYKPKMSLEKFYQELQKNDLLELGWLSLDQTGKELSCIFSLFAICPVPWEQVESVLGQLYLPTAMMEKLLESKSQNSEQDIEKILRDYVQKWRKAKDDLLQLNWLQELNKDVFISTNLIRSYGVLKLQNIDTENNFKTAFIDVMIAVAKQIPETINPDIISQIEPAIPHVIELATTWNTYISAENMTLIHNGIGRFYQSQGLEELASTWFAKNSPIE